MQTPTQKKRRPFWLRFLIGAGITIGIIVLLLVITAAFFNKQISRQVLNELGKNLKTELQVGDTQLSLLKGFPNASVNLTDVRLKDAFGDYLLAAREISFRFKLTSLFGNRIEIKDMHISGGGIRIRITERGLANYEVFKDSGSDEDSALRIALENAELKNLLISFHNARTKQTAEVNLRTAGFAGNFSSEKFNLSSQADFTVSRLQLDKSRYLLGENIRYNAVIDVDLTKDLYDFQRVDLTVGGNTFAVEGIAVDKPAYTDLNLKFLSKEGDISVIFDLLPEPYHSYFNDFQSSGTYDFTGFVLGRAGKTQTPTIGAEVALRNGQLLSEKLQSPLRNVSFKATYSAPPTGSGIFEIADFKGNFGGEPLDLALKITQLDDPVVDFQCHGALPLAAGFGLFGNPDITGGDGVVRLNSLSVQGRYADMIDMGRVNAVQASGEVQFEEAGIVYKNVPLTVRSGRLRLENNLIAVDSLLVQAGNSDFSLRSSARNLLPVLFADSLNTADAQLEFSAGLHSRNLDLTQLINLFSVEEKAVAGGQPEIDSLRTAGNVGRQQLTDKLNGVFEARIEHLEYEKIRVDEFDGRLAFDHNQLAIKGDARTMDGLVNLDGIAHFAISPTLQMKVIARHLDLQTCMEECNNFGQGVITDANLRGRLSGRVVVWAFWNERNDFLLDKLRAYADIQATNGQLVNLKMLEDFSNFVHIEDLRDVRFTGLQNYLEISKGQLYLPVMFIQNNALNLTLSGTHTFDNDIDYKIKVNVGQTLWNRIKSKDDNFDPLPQKKGWFNAYYSIVGNLDKYEMKKGRKEVQSAFERSEARKQLIAAAIDQEFSGVYTRPPIEDENEFLDEIVGGAGVKRE
jgi:hypothetical protein